DPAEVFDTFRPETKLVYLESPGSLVFRLQDIEAIAKYCREKKITTAIDNSYSTPIFQQPTKYGIDMVVHTATKYLGGHSDITAGVVASTSERLAKMTGEEIALFGTLIAPFPAWLLTRGLRTLPIRMKRHEESGNAVAEFLTKQKAVERVHH